MTTHIKTKLKKIKKRRILILSPGGGIPGSVQCLYIQVSNTWELISHVIVPYSQKINILFEKFGSDSGEQLTLSDIAGFDYKLSQFCIESIKTLLSQIPSAYKKPHYIIFNKLPLWRGLTGESNQQQYWDLSVGDPQLIASSLDTPVFTDFIRHNIIAGGAGVLPLNPGNSIIVSQTKGIVALVNIGLLLRITVIDTATSRVLYDSDVGPGTYLINKEIKNISATVPFDRDGTVASQGTVNSQCLDILASQPWFQNAGSKQAIPEQFNDLLSVDSLKQLPVENRIATLTALPAKLLYDFYRREIFPGGKIDQIFVSGGGVHNLTLMEFLSTYFNPVPVQSIEAIHVPPDMRLPLALGLTIDAHVNDAIIPWESGGNPRIDAIGKWILP